MLRPLIHQKGFKDFTTTIGSLLKHILIHHPKGFPKSAILSTIRTWWLHRIQKGKIKLKKEKEKRKTEDQGGKATLTIVAAFEDVALHLEVAVFGSEVNLGCQHHLDVLLLLRQLARRCAGGCSGGGHCGCGGGGGMPSERFETRGTGRSSVKCRSSPFKS